MWTRTKLKYCLYLIICSSWMKITICIIICAKLDVLFWFESARRSILPVLRWLFWKRLGEILPCLGLILYWTSVGYCQNHLCKISFGIESYKYNNKYIFLPVNTSCFGYLPPRLVTISGVALYGGDSRHFEKRRTSNLKGEALNPKPNILVKTQCLYYLWFWRSSRHKFSE